MSFDIPNDNDNLPGTGTGIPDLSQYDEQFAGAPAEREDVPDGKYQVKVQRAILAVSKKSGNPMLKWELVILAGPHTNRRIFRNNVIMAGDQIKYLKQDLHTAGLDLERVSELEANLGKLLDVCLEVSVVTKGENKNCYLNRKLELAAVAQAPTGTDASGANIPF